MCRRAVQACPHRAGTAVGPSVSPPTLGSVLRLGLSSAFAHPPIRRTAETGRFRPHLHACRMAGLHRGHQGRPPVAFVFDRYPAPTSAMQPRVFWQPVTQGECGHCAQYAKSGCHRDTPYSRSHATRASGLAHKAGAASLLPRRSREVVCWSAAGPWWRVRLIHGHVKRIRHRCNALSPCRRVLEEPRGRSELDEPAHFLVATRRARARLRVTMTIVSSGIRLRISWPTDSVATGSSEEAARRAAARRGRKRAPAPGRASAAGRRTGRTPGRPAGC